MEDQVNHINDLEGLNSELEGFLSDLHGREETLGARIKELEDELFSAREAYNAEMERFVRKEAALSASLEEARNALSSESTAAISLASERDDLARRLEAASKALDDEKSRAADKDLYVHSSRSVLKDKEAEVDKIWRSLEELKAELTLERATVKDREAQIQKYVKIREGLEKRLEQAAQEGTRCEEGFTLKVELLKNELREQIRKAEDLERKLSAAAPRMEEAIAEAAHQEKLYSEAKAALAEKEAVLKDANVRIRTLLKELETARSSSGKDTAERAQELASSLAARVDELEAELSAAAARSLEKVRSSQAALSDAQAALRAREEENAQHKARESTLLRELSDAEEKWKFSSAQLHNAFSKLRAAENENEINASRLKSLEEERNKFRAAAIKAEASASALVSQESLARDSEAAGLMAALEEQAGKYTALLRKYDDLVLANEAIRLEKDSALTEVEALRNSIKNIESGAAGASGAERARYAEVSSRLRDAQALLKKRDMELEAALEARSALEVEIETLNYRLAEVEEGAAAASGAEKARYAELSGKLHNAGALLKQKEFELDEARSALSGLESECTLLRRSRIELGEKYAREIQAENEMLKEAQGRILERDNTISKLSLTENELKNEAEALRKEKQNLAALMRKKSAPAHSARATEAERLLADKESRLEKLRAELDDTRAEKAELQGREKELREELKARPYRAMLREAEEKLVIKEKMLSEVNSRMKKIGMDFDELKSRGQSSGAPGYMPDFEELVAGVAHQIANSISIIRSHAEFCSEAPEAEGAKESLDVIVRNIVALQKKIDTIMNFSRPVIPQRSPERVSSVLSEVLTSLRSSGRLKGVKVRQKGGDKLKDVSLDRVRFATALEQLLVNAAEAMPAGGEITISVSSSGGRQRLEIADTGEGVEKKNMGAIFHPFFTTRPGKMGLGLTLARNVVRAHGGTLELSSEHGKGATAIIELPEA